MFCDNLASIIWAGVPDRHQQMENKHILQFYKYSWIQKEALNMSPTRRKSLQHRNQIDSFLKRMITGDKNGTLTTTSMEKTWSWSNFLLYVRRELAKNHI